MNDKYVAVPREDWEGILDSVRGKTGKTALLKSGEVKPEIDGIKTGGGSGGGGGTEGYITFYDYDGTIVTSWTKEQLEAATELPENPEHEGLTAQGWNWTLDELKAEGGEMDVGQMYITSDGKTHVFIELEEARREICVGLAVNGTVEIDFGDGSAPVTLTGITETSRVAFSSDHKYPAGGAYEITISVVSGAMRFYGSSNGREYIISPPSTSGLPTTNTEYFQNTIKKILIGNIGVAIPRNAFCYCRSLESINIPQNITNIGNEAFKYCTSLKSLIIPRKVQGLETYDMFQYCNSMRSICIPNGVTRIGNSLLHSCNTLSKVNFPKTISRMDGGTFSNCQNIKKVKFPEKATFTNGDFQNCCALSSVILSEGMATIGYQTFYGCNTLPEITLPKSITQIGNQAFYNCYSLKKCRVKSQTPPTLGTDVFKSVPWDFWVVVNPGCVDEYIAATNWSAEAAKIYSEHNVSFTWGSGVLRLIDPPDKLYYNSSTPYENIIRAEFDPDYTFDGAYDINGQGVEVTLGDVTDGEGGTVIAELHAVITDPDADDFEIYIASM